MTKQDGTGGILMTEEIITNDRLVLMDEIDRDVITISINLITDVTDRQSMIAEMVTLEAIEIIVETTVVEGSKTLQPILPMFPEAENILR